MSNALQTSRGAAESAAPAAISRLHRGFGSSPKSASFRTPLRRRNGQSKTAAQIRTERWKNVSNPYLLRKGKKPWHATKRAEQKSAGAIKAPATRVATR